MPIIGIDLGTSDSAAAVLRNGHPIVIPNTEGVTLVGKAFPSYVALTGDGQLLVGERARHQMTMNPDGTATAFKGLMGCQEKIALHDRQFSAEELSTFLLQKIRRDAEAFLGEPVKAAVIAVPAYYNDNQRDAAEGAAHRAGLEMVGFINEPIAAALAYGLDKLGAGLRAAVIDFGGGTLDVTILEFAKGVFEVRAANGSTQLGGSNIDSLIFDHFIGLLRSRTQLDVSNDRIATTRLKEASEVAKIELTDKQTTHISLRFLMIEPSGPVHFEYDLTRWELERLTRSVVDRCREPVLKAFQAANIQPSQVDRLVLAGGTTRMPMVRAFFEELAGRRAESGIDPMECVAKGAAIHGGALVGNGLIDCEDR